MVPYTDGKSTSRPVMDKNVSAVIDKIHLRSKLGQLEYGTSTDRAGLSRIEWLKHAQEEALDLAIYLEQLIRMESE
jgi:hypothetical protein